MYEQNMYHFRFKAQICHFGPEICEKEKRRQRNVEFCCFFVKNGGLILFFRIGNSDASCSSTGLLASNKNTDSDALINPDDESDDDQGAGYNQASDSGYNVT